MPERISDDVRLVVEATSSQLPALAGYAPYSAGRAISASGARTVIARGGFEPGAAVHVASDSVVVVPGDIDPDAAVLVPPVMAVMDLWSALRLELGDAALWTMGHPLSALVGQVGLWRGACPAIALQPTSHVPAIEGAPPVDGSDPESAAARLAELVAMSPGFAAVELSGRPDIIDTVLEAIPRFGRLLLAGPAGEPSTIDFYKNVHRKGIVISTTVLDPTSVFDGTCALRAQLARAVAVVAAPAVGRSVRELLDAPGLNSRVSVGTT